MKTRSSLLWEGKIFKSYRKLVADNFGSASYRFHQRGLAIVLNVASGTTLEFSSAAHACESREGLGLSCWLFLGFTLPGHLRGRLCTAACDEVSFRAPRCRAAILTMCDRDPASLVRVPRNR